MAGYRAVLAAADGDASLLDTLPESATLRAEVVHAVRSEMARRLDDVVFRRTDLGTAGAPGEAALAAAAALMGDELGWDEARRREEIARAATATSVDTPTTRKWRTNSTLPRCFHRPRRFLSAP